MTRWYSEKKKEHFSKNIHIYLFVVFSFLALLLAFLIITGWNIIDGFPSDGEKQNECGKYGCQGYIKCIDEEEIENTEALTCELDLDNSSIGISLVAYDENMENPYERMECSLE